MSGFGAGDAMKSSRMVQSSKSLLDGELWSAVSDVETTGRESFVVREAAATRTAVCGGDEAELIGGDGEEATAAVPPLSEDVE